MMLPPYAEDDRYWQKELRLVAINVLAEQPTSDRLWTDLPNVVRIKDLAEQFDNCRSSVGDRLRRDPAFKRVDAFDPRESRPAIGWSLDSDVRDQLEGER